MNSSDEAVSPVKEIAQPPSPGGELGTGASPPVQFDERRPFATPVLLAANLVWFTAGIVIAPRLGVSIGSYFWFGHPIVIERLGAVSAAALWDGDWWRLFTCCFVHVGFWHLLMNMVGLVMVGPVAEWLWGRWRVFGIYLLAGLGGACAAMALRPVEPTFGIPVIVAGASGAFWGMMGSLAAWLLLYHRSLHREDARYFASRLGFALLLNIGISLLPGVSWEGHAGGGVVGFAAAVLLNGVRTGRCGRRVVALLLLAAVPVACVGGLVWTMKVGESWAPVRSRMMVREAIAFTHRPAARDLVARAALGAFLGIDSVIHAWASDQELISLFDALSPVSTRPIESQAVLLLGSEPERRKPETVAALRAKLTDILKSAEELDRRLSAPTGNAALDSRREKARGFVEARVEAMKLLLQMLDSKEAPGTEAWKTWGEAKSRADRLWAEINEPAPKK
jgi:membrane associated rhomboid family serine protease